MDAGGLVDGSLVMQMGRLDLKDLVPELPQRKLKPA